MKTALTFQPIRWALDTAGLLAVLGCLLALGPLDQARAQSGWTRFRGPDGAGVGEASSIPVAFDEANYRWQTKLPGDGHSSPVLWENKVFLTCRLEDQNQRMVVCLSAVDGRILWLWKDRFEEYKQHSFNNFAASTPAVDADRVYVSWVSGKTFMVLALDHNGQEVWQRRMEDYQSRFGAGASPIVLDGLVIMGNLHPGKSSFLIGLDAATGQTRWQLKRTSASTSFVTPAVYRPKNGPPELIFASHAHGITSVDPRTGQVNWEVGELFTMKIVTSPVVADGLIFATAGKGGAGRESVAVRPPTTDSGGRGELVYKLESSLPYVPTPIACGEYLFVYSDAGVVTCIRAATGEQLWQERVSGELFSSPVRLGNRIYSVTKKGEVVVIEASSQYKPLAQSRLPEGSYATPAVANDCMYFRTFTHLICVGAGKP